MDVVKFRTITVDIYTFDDTNLELYNPGLCDFDIDNEKVFIITRTKVMKFIPVFFCSSEFFKRKNIIYCVNEECKNDVIMVFKKEKQCSKTFDLIQNYSKQDKENGNYGMFGENDKIIEKRFLLPIIRQIKDDDNPQNFEDLLKDVINAANDEERKKYLNILKKKKLYNTFFNEKFEDESEETDNNNIDSQQGNTDMDEEDDDDVTIIVKTETDDIDDEESKTLGFAENKCDVIILESDTEEEEENVAFFEEEESSEERDENDDDEIIVLDSDSEDDFEESSENIQSLKDEEELKNDENSNFGYIDNDLEDDVILRIKPEINDDDGDCKYEAEEEENKEQIETSAIVDEIKKPDDFPMFQFLKFIKDVNAHKKDKLLKLKGRPDIVKIAASIPELDKHRDFYMSPGFNTNFNNLFKTAARRKNIYLDHVTTIINRYLTDGESVEYFDGFPKAPSRPINMYISEKADGEQNNIQTIARKRKSFSSGEIDRKPYFEKYVNESKEYIKKIEQYLHQERKNLCESHVVHIQNLISKKEKEIEKAALGESEPVPSRKKSKRQIKTAFDYFKDANPNLYSDYETERRNSKLLKKFNRLEDNVKQIYENIAARNA